MRFWRDVYKDCVMLYPPRIDSNLFYVDDSDVISCEKLKRVSLKGK